MRNSRCAANDLPWPDNAERGTQEGKSAIEVVELEDDRPRINTAAVAGRHLVVRLDDHRTLRLVLDWFPGIRRAPREYQTLVQLSDQQDCVFWPRLGRSVSVQALLVAHALEQAAESAPRA